MMNPAIPDPIGELGRGVMRATEGMTPEQKIAYIQQNAASGIAPQSVLFLMMKQQERLRAAQPPMQSMPTVREKLAAAAPPIEQGLGAVPTGVMNSANYAGGGIVVFAEGGNEGLDADPAAGISQLARDTAQKQLLQMIAQAESAGQMQRATVLRGQLRRMLAGSETSMARDNVDIGQFFRENFPLTKAQSDAAKAAKAAKQQAAVTPVEQDMAETVSKGSAKEDTGRKEQVVAAPRPSEVPWYWWGFNGIQRVVG
jgi:hypothetical protein